MTAIRTTAMSTKILASKAKMARKVPGTSCACFWQTKRLHINCLRNSYITKTQPKRGKPDVLWTIQRSLPAMATRSATGAVCRNIFLHKSPYSRELVYVWMVAVRMCWWAHGTSAYTALGLPSANSAATAKPFFVGFNYMPCWEFVWRQKKRHRSTWKLEIVVCCGKEQAMAIFTFWHLVKILIVHSKFQFIIDRQKFLLSKLCKTKW